MTRVELERAEFEVVTLPGLVHRSTWKVIDDARADSFNPFNPSLPLAAKYEERTLEVRVFAVRVYGVQAYGVHCAWDAKRSRLLVSRRVSDEDALCIVEELDG